MTIRKVHCPECKILLQIPGDFKGTKVRCAKCSNKFLVPAFSEYDILDVLGHGNKDETSFGQSIDDIIDDIPEDLFGESDAEIKERQKYPDGYPTGINGLKMLRVGKNGPVFEINSLLLEGTKLRSAMPQVCTRCGAKNHIRPKLVVFAHQMLDSSSIQGEFVEDDEIPDFTDVEIRNATPAQLVARMPELRKIPAPANSPMPYWICDMCSPSGLIFAQNEVDPKTHKGICQLQIKRIWRAEQFLVNLGGKDSPAHEKLLRVINQNPETAWDALAESVQNRIKQWYKPQRGEQFVTYTPDRRHSRTEDGMAGVVITNRRLIYHSSRRHFENIKGQHIGISFMTAGGEMKIRIKGYNWEIQQMLIDKIGLERLRRALVKEKYEAKWQ